LKPPTSISVAGWLVMWRSGTIIACNLASWAQRVPFAGSHQTVLLASANNIKLTDGGIELPAESVAIVGLSQPNQASGTL
jgi:hypothetical protein